MVGLYNDPEGKNVFSMTDPNQSTEIREDSSTTETLRYRIRELEKQLEKKVQLLCCHHTNLRTHGPLVVQLEFSISSEIIIAHSVDYCMHLSIGFGYNYVKACFSAM